MLASYSLEEYTLLIWQPSGGLFGALAGAFGMPGTGLGTHAPAALSSMKISRTFKLERSLSSEFYIVPLSLQMNLPLPLPFTPPFQTHRQPTSPP